MCARLGFWQLSRLRQRQAANAAYRETLARPVGDLAVDTAGMAPGRRVGARGRFDFSRQVIVESRSFQGAPALVIVTPLVLADSSAVLVERGWVPAADGRELDRDRYGEPDSATVTGLLVVPPAASAPVPDSPEWPKRVRWADPQALAAQFPYPLLPLVLRREQAAGSLRPVPPPELDNGPHLSYAIQWFSFAVIVIVGGVILSLTPARRRATL